jgi:hypothetical protein
VVEKDPSYQVCSLPEVTVLGTRGVSMSREDRQGEGKKVAPHCSSGLRYAGSGVYYGHPGSKEMADQFGGTKAAREAWGLGQL